MNMNQWCVEQHTKTNHFYDQYLSYEFHLRMAYQVGRDFKHLLDDLKDYYSGDNFKRSNEDPITLRTACLRAIWGHDLIEDTRASYGDVKNHLGQEAADIIYAVTNDKGKTRGERAGDKYYQGIRDTPGAVFVKLCDRIANVQYGKMTKSHMFEMYKNENINFMISLGREVGDPYEEMYQYLINLFND
jgi:hypothetical protein